MPANSTRATANSNFLIDALTDLDLAMKWLIGMPVESSDESVAASMQGIKRNSLQDLHTIEMAGLVSGVTFLTLVVVFIVLKWICPQVYAFRTQEELVEHRDVWLKTPTRWSIVCWATYAWAVDDEKVLKIAGIDSFLYLEFHKFCLKVLMIIGPVVMLVLCPAHYYLGSRVWYDPGLGEVREMDSYSRLGMKTLTAPWHAPDFVVHEGLTAGASNELLCWIHVAVVFFVVIVTVRMIRDAQKKFLDIHFNWLKEVSAPRSTTVLVHNIPNKLRSDEAIFSYFAALFSSQAIKRAYVVRDTDWKHRHLHAKVESLESRLRSLEEAQLLSRSAEPSMVRESVHRVRLSLRSALTGLPNHEDEAIAALRDSLEQASKDFEAHRAEVEDKAQSGDLAICSTTAFITFSSRRWCKLAIRQQLMTDRNTMRMNLPPDPTDVRYEDLACDAATKASSRTLLMLLILLIFICWVPLTVFVSSLARLEELQHYKAFAWLQPLFDHNPQIESVFEGVLATLVLKIVMAILPTVLYEMLNFCGVLSSHRRVQLWMQKVMFGYLVVFVVLVSALSQTVVHTLKRLAHDPTEAFNMMSKLPMSSHFYISYLMVGCSLLPMNLLRAGPFGKYLLFKLLWGSSANETRKWSEPENEASYGMGARMSETAAMMVLAILYCSAAPSIIVAAIIYITLSMTVHRWLAVYAETKKPELGGAFWDTAMGHIFFALGLYVALMCAVLERSPHGKGLPAFCVFLCGVWLFRSYLKYGEVQWDKLPYEAVVEKCHGRDLHSTEGEDRGRPARGKSIRSSIIKDDEDEDSGWYVQPECVSQDGEIPGYTAGQDKREDGDDFQGRRETMSGFAQLSFCLSESGMSGFASGGRL